jgi:hypothetical protein
MVSAIEITWEEASAPDFEHTSRQAFRAAVDQVAVNAKATLPESSGRVDKAVQIVLAGDVELLPDGHARVASQCQGTTQHHVVNGTCDCPDFSRAPASWCKHRIAAGLFKRATALAKQPLALPEPAQESVPEQPETSNVPSEFVVLIQGRPFVRFAGLLRMAHQRGLQSLEVGWTYNDADLSLAHAVAVFQDGRRFEESGDATPSNTNRKVSLHFRRVALTRAKARVLRDALGCDLVAVEELADEP